MPSGTGDAEDANLNRSGLPISSRKRTGVVNLKNSTDGGYWTLGPALVIITSMATKRTRKLSDQLRQAIDESGLTRYQIAKETGIDESALAKFYNGHRGLSLEALDRLAECLDLVVHSRRKPNQQ